MPARYRAAPACAAAALILSACESPLPADSDPVRGGTPSDTVPGSGSDPDDSPGARPADSAVPPPGPDSALPPSPDSGAARGGGVRAAPLFDPARLPLEKPVWFGSLPGVPGAFLALEQFAGKAVLLRREGGEWVRTDFLGLTVRREGEMGLLALAFHPRFPRDRRYYVSYVPAGGTAETVLEEREADPSLLKDSGRPGRAILRLPQPYHNHKSATPAFGPRDGYLYVAVGDGGATAAGQDSSRLLGKLLRLDVNAPDSFRVPEDNPFVGRDGARPEIWALGLRNPWRWSFDALTGEAWIADVGEEQREEIDIARAGDNLGWGRMEGTFCHPDADCGGGLRAPVMDFGRDRLTAIIGGYVYRGDPGSPWYGAYFFADYGSRALWVLRPGKDGRTAAAEKLLTLPSAPSSFGADGDGNLYLVGYGNGAIYRLERDGPSGPGRL